MTQTKSLSSRDVLRCTSIVTALAVGLGTLTATAETILPTSYSMRNGEIGAFAYLDDSYNGSGDPTVQLSDLSGGLGDLTDGVIPDQRWSQLPSAYVGWRSVDPVIRFEFEQMAKFQQVTFYFDDTEGQGQVNAPAQIRLTDGIRTKEMNVNDTPQGGQLVVAIDNVGLTGDYVEATIMRGAAWMMLGEVQFDGEFVPEPSSFSASCLGLGVLAVIRRRRRG